MGNCYCEMLAGLWPRPPVSIMHAKLFEEIIWKMMMQITDEINHVSHILQTQPYRLIGSILNNMILSPPTMKK